MLMSPFCCFKAAHVEAGCECVFITGPACFFEGKGERSLHTYGSIVP